MQAIFDNYPAHMRLKMQRLRELIFATADGIEEISELHETLKWGEPSYVTKKGSTLRMNWKEKSPNQYAMYFQCSSQLVHTFRLVYGDLFNYENNRAIIFQLDEKIPEDELIECIKMTLTYHSIKHLPMLGAI